MLEAPVFAGTHFVLGISRPNHYYELYLFANQVDALRIMVLGPRTFQTSRNMVHNEPRWVGN
jgi:hypothetical protein